MSELLNPDSTSGEYYYFCKRLEAGIMTSTLHDQISRLAEAITRTQDQLQTLIAAYCETTGAIGKVFSVLSSFNHRIEQLARRVEALEAHQKTRINASTYPFDYLHHTCNPAETFTQNTTNMCNQNGQRVFVIDSDASTLWWIRKNLEAKGVVCVTVDCLDDATSLLQINAFDLILIDCNLWSEASSWLSSAKIVCPVVLLTSDANFASPNSAQGVLLKPISTDNLLAVTMSFAGRDSQVYKSTSNRLNLLRHNGQERWECKHRTTPDPKYTAY